MEPAMSEKHRSLIAEVLSCYNPLTVFEWGAGESTIFFTGLFPTCKWIAAETNFDWVLSALSSTYDRQVYVKWFDYGVSKQDFLKRLPLDEYVNYPSLMREKIDVFIVDGRKRARCIAEARKHIGDRGAIILHDAEREFYHQACEELRIDKHKDETGSELWIMRNPR